MESNIVSFTEAARAAWEADFKKRWQAKNEGAGEFTSDIWAWQEMLEQDGWIVQFYDNVMPEFSAFINFDKKLLTANIPKAYHMQKTMGAMLDEKFAGATGRRFYEWKEVHDDAHRHVRDSDEWKDDKEYYMTVWYSMELYVREMQPDEDIPVAPKEISEPVSKLLNTLEPLTPLVEYMTEKTLQERFNYWDVPRDGRVSNPKHHPKTAVEEFLLDAAVAAYVIVPREHWIWLMENGLAHSTSKVGFFTALPMTEGNMKGGVVGKVGSAMIFSDVYAHPDKSYPENTLIHFAQMDGEYMRELEHSRCPFFLVNRNEGIGAELDIPKFNQLDFLSAWYKNNNRETQAKSLSIPARYWADFYLWIVTTRENEYAVNPDPASQLDGHHGLYRGVPVYTDAFLVEGLRDPNALIYIELEKVSA